MATISQDVLVVLPTDRDRSALDSVDETYQIHWMDHEDFSYPRPKAAFDMVEYTERCSAYVEEHDIDGVVYSHDWSNLVAGVLSERHDLPGPDLESMFLTNHKYYSRRRQPETIWSDYVDIETGEWGHLEPRFPAYVKPPAGTMTLVQHRVDSQSELDAALAMIRENLTASHDILIDFFDAYLDTDEYPLAVEDIAVVEKPVENWTQHCVEGWVDPDGTVNIWAISDQNYYPSDRLAIDNYSTPSTMPADQQQAMVDHAIETVRAHGVEGGFWNVEIWDKEERYLVTEINGRAATVWHDLYQGTFGTSLYDAMLALAAGDAEEIHEIASEWESGMQPDRVGGQFHAITFGEGRAEEFLDFEYARSIEETDLELFVSPDDEIEQTRTSGHWLARFHLFGPDYDAIAHRADEIREGLLKRPERSPVSARQS